MIVNNDEEFDRLKDQIEQDTPGSVGFDQSQIPLEYPCIVKWVEDRGIEFGSTDDDDDDEEVMVGEISIYRFFFVSKKEIEELLKN